jgi:tRNA U34 5-carboxymethylaminomethyl modifying GTPase MnmE/TrmE
LAAADAIVLVFDASEAWADEDDVLYHQWPHAIVVHNKNDAAQTTRDKRPPGLATCALDGSGVDQLIVHLAQQLVPSPPAQGAAVPFTERQITGLQDLLTQLDKGNPKNADAILRELLTGQ